MKLRVWFGALEIIVSLFSIVFATIALRKHYLDPQADWEGNLILGGWFLMLSGIALGIAGVGTILLEKRIWTSYIPLLVWFLVLVGIDLGVIH